MAVEQFQSRVLEARNELAASLVSQLTQIQTSQAEGTFSFSHHVGETPRDPRTLEHQFLVGMQIIGSYERQTWDSFTYSDGRLQSWRKQYWNNSDENPREIPETRKDIAPQEIPFNEFSDKELIAAGKAIESVSKPTS